jgi:hypothetical protein
MAQELVASPTALAERIATARERIERANREARRFVHVDDNDPDDAFAPAYTLEDYQRAMTEELDMHVDAEHYASWLEYDARDREEMLAGLRLDARAAEIGDLDNPVGMERLALDPGSRDDCSMHSGYVRRWAQKQHAKAAPVVDAVVADTLIADLKTQLGDEGFEAWRCSVFALRDALVEEEVADYAGQLDGDLDNPPHPRLARAWRRADAAFARLARYARRPDTRQQAVGAPERGREARRPNVRRGPH